MQILVVATLVLVHLVAGKLRFLRGIPRSRWLSAAGGISVAYVFMHVFPELEEAQRSIQAFAGVGAAIERHAYLVALCGLGVFYGMERLVRSSQQRHGETPDAGAGETTTGEGVFWLHIGSFALYNALIGYLIVHREEQDTRGLLIFAAAMALHFVVNDFGLEQDHRNTYRRLGRWILAAAVVAGWGFGLATTASEAAVGVLFAFLAGGVILNVLKEELPEQRQSRFWAFAVGAAAYAALLLLI